MEIVAIAQTPEFIANWGRVSALQGLNLEGFLSHDLKELDLTGKDAIFLETPFLVEQKFVDFGQVWQKFLLRRSPNTKLLQCGFDALEAPGYLDLLALPEVQIDHLVKMTPPLSWEVPIPKGRGTEALDSLSRFFDGHGNQSIMSVIYQVDRKLQMLQREIEIGEFEYDELIKNHIKGVDLERYWEKVRYRWENYESFLVLIPDCHKIEEIRNLIKQIEPFFALSCSNKELFESLNVPSLFKLLQSNLAEIRDQYVGQ